MRNIIFIFLLTLTGCTETSNTPVTESNTGNNSTTTALVVNLILRDKFNQESSSFIQGEDVYFYLNVANTTNSDITVNFNSGQQYDFYVEAENIEIWRWSSNLFFTLSLTSLIIPAQKSIVINQIWNQSLISGNNTPIGNYTAYGSLLNQSPTAQYNFTVQ